MKALMSAFLFWTMLFQVSTEPIVCWSCSTNNCRPPGITYCSPRFIEKGCYSKVIDFPLEGHHRQQTLRYKQGCVRSEDCHPLNYTASLPGDGYIYMKVECCNKIFCNDPIMVPPQKNRPLNGMQCPGCLNRMAKEPCTSETTVSCHGQENKCVAYTGRLNARVLYYPKLSIKGCTTEGLCDLLTGATEEGRDMMAPSDTVEAECSSAENSV